MLCRAKKHGVATFSQESFREGSIRKNPDPAAHHAQAENRQKKTVKNKKIHYENYLGWRPRLRRFLRLMSLPCDSAALLALLLLLKFLVPTDFVKSDVCLRDVFSFG